MRLFCSQKDLAWALNIVNKAVSPNNTLPVLNNILLKTENGKLFFSATNLELAITYTIDADIKEEGAITIPAKLFTSFISLITDDTVELKALENLMLHVKSPSSDTKIKGISADEFPLIPKVDAEHTLKLPLKDLYGGISKTSFASSMNTSRPVLAGVLFDINKDMLKLVATDSYRLAEMKISLVPATTIESQYIIPSRTIVELGKILEKLGDEEVELHFAKNQVLFNVGKARIISRLIEGKFPDYQKIIPREHKTRVESKIGDLSLIMRRASLFSRENNNSMKLSVTTDGLLKVDTDETRVGEDKAEITVKVEGEENGIAINSQYLLDVLGAFSGNEVMIELNDKLSPAVVKPMKGEDYLYLIMPLKI